MSSDEFDRSARRVFERLRRDASRWVVPEGFADPATIRPVTIVRLFLRHRQFRPIVWLRLGDWGHGSPRVRGLEWLCEQAMGRYGIDIPPSSSIEGGFYVGHPAGVAITTSHIGCDVTVVGSVTIGIRGAGTAGPTIGDRAFIGAGARVIGPIHVGAEARVGANAVVLDDVPDGATVVGVPARVRGPSVRPVGDAS